MSSQGNLTVAVGKLTCSTDFNLHNPNIRYTTSTQAPTCSAPKSMVTGSPSGQGQHTVCCL